MSYFHNSNPNQLLQSNQMTPQYYNTALKTKPLDSANTIFFWILSSGTVLVSNTHST